MNNNFFVFFLRLAPSLEITVCNKIKRMKKILIVCIMALASFAFTGQTNAQLRIGVNFNIGSQPAWGPAGYDYVHYYYLPDLDAYYDVLTDNLFTCRAAGGNSLIHYRPGTKITICIADIK